MKTQRSRSHYQNQGSRRGRNSYGRFNEDRNARNERYGRNSYGDTEGRNTAWDREYESEGRNYSRDYDRPYAERNDRYENRDVNYRNDSERYYEGRNSNRNNYYEDQRNGSDYDRQANYDYDNERSEYGDRNYGSSLYNRGRNEEYDYTQNGGRQERQGPNRTYPSYGTDRYYGNERESYLDTDMEDARTSYGTGSYGNGGRYGSSYSSGSRNNQYDY